MKSRTTGSATSASSSAMRTSRSMSCTLPSVMRGLAAHRLDEARQAVGEGGGHSALPAPLGARPRKYTVMMILSSASGGFSGAWGVALAAVAAYVLGGVSGPAPMAAASRPRLSSACLLHAVLLLLDISGLGSDSAVARAWASAPWCR